MARDAVALQPDSRRIKYVKVTAELILELLKVPEQGVVIDGKTLKCVSDAIPETAKVVRSHFDESGDIALVIEHESFALVLPGQHVLQIHPVYQLSDTVLPERAIK